MGFFSKKKKGSERGSQVTKSEATVDDAASEAAPEAAAPLPPASPAPRRPAGLSAQQLAQSHRSGSTLASPRPKGAAPPTTPQRASSMSAAHSILAGLGKKPPGTPSGAKPAPKPGTPTGGPPGSPLQKSAQDILSMINRQRGSPVPKSPLGPKGAATPGIAPPLGLGGRGAGGGSSATLARSQLQGGGRGGTSPNMGRGTPFRGKSLGSPGRQGSVNALMGGIIGLAQKNGQMPPPSPGPGVPAESPALGVQRQPSVAGSGRGRGGVSIQQLRSPSVAGSQGSLLSWMPGKVVYIRPLENPIHPEDHAARGSVVEPQGDSILVKPEPSWATTHREELYPKRRLQHMPPRNCSVEIRHNLPQYNGRYGRVLGYDQNPKRAEGVRVQLVATAEHKEEAVLFKLSAVKQAPRGALGTPRQGPQAHDVPPSPVTSIGRALEPPPTPTRNHVKGLFGAAAKGAPSVRRASLQEYLHSLPRNSLNLLGVKDMMNVHRKLKELPDSHMVTEAEWTAIIAQTKDMPSPMPRTELEPGSPIRRVSSVIVDEEFSDPPRRESTVAKLPTPLETPTHAPQGPVAPPTPAEPSPQQVAEMAAAKSQAEEMSKKYEAELKEKEELRKKLQKSKDERDQIETNAKVEKKKKKIEERMKSMQEKETDLRHAYEDQEEAKRESLQAQRTEGVETVKERSRRQAEIKELTDQLEAVKKDAAAKEKDAAVEAARLAAAPPPPPPTANSTDLWANFKKALSENGASIKDISHANEDQLMSLLTDNLKFSKLDALRIGTLWREKRGKKAVQESESGDTSDLDGISALLRKKSAKKRKGRSGSRSPARETSHKRGRARGSMMTVSSETGADTFDDPSESHHEHHEDSQQLIAKHKGKRVVLNPTSQDYAMVSEVLRHTSSCGDSTFSVHRVVQLLPSQNQISRYDKSRVRLQSGCRQPKVLYYAGPTLPAISEVMQEGFHAELRRHRSLQFSTEANIEEAARHPGGESAMLLLCEVLTGRVVRVPQSSHSSLNRQALKVCGPSNPPKGISYQGDSIAMDYAHAHKGAVNADTSLDQMKTATRYVLTDPDRVVPRYLVYLKVSPPPPELPPAGLNVSGGLPSPLPYTSTPNPLQPYANGGSTSPHRQPTMPQQEPHATTSSFVSLMGLNANIKSLQPSPTQPTLVMCPLHPSEELSLYCVGEEELTCTICASVGRHSGKKCQPLGELLEGMRSHLVVHEKQVASKLAQTEVGLAQIQKQLEVLKDSEDRARLNIRKRSTELLEETAGRCEMLEQELNTKSSEIATRFHGSIRQHADRAGNLRLAHDKIKALVDASHSRPTKGRKNGVSAKAADIISLSKLLEQIKDEPVDDLLALQSYGAMFTEDVQNELSRLRLPPPTISSHYLRPQSVRYGSVSPTPSPLLAASPPRGY